MATYHTQGLPDGTHKETNYQFSIHQNKSMQEGENTYSIFIPGNYIGRDQIGDPTYPEQAAWLNSLSSNHKIKEVWYGTWEIIGNKDYIESIALLTFP